MIQFSVYKKLDPEGPTPDIEINLEIPSQENIGILGPSGAGKTTLLKILAGLISPDSGKLKVNDDLWFDSDRKINRAPQQRDIGFVFQDYALFPNMNVRENLEFALPGNANRHRLHEILEMLDIASIAGQKPGTLSGGQKQRVGLGRALIRQPRLLLLDEPLSALDPEMRTKLRHDLLRISSNFDGIMILVSHNPAEIVQLTDRAIMLRKGRVTQNGNPAELLYSQPAQNMKPGVVKIIEVLSDKNILVVTSHHGLLHIPYEPSENPGIRIGDTISLKATL